MKARVLAVVVSVGCLNLIETGVWGQSRPADAATRPATWDDIDQRLVFFTVQLASVETSLDATDRQLRATGYRMTVRQEDAARHQKGNELMDRNGGGPRRWPDFYGDTAERFFFRSDSGPLRRTTSVLDTNHRRSTHDSRPADARPPQFDYIYRANDNARAEAEADVAALAGKVDALLARRRHLEAEQSWLWLKIAFRAVAGRELLHKPLYRFELKSDGGHRRTGQRLEAMNAAMAMLRSNNRLCEQADQTADGRQGEYIAAFAEGVVRGRGEFEEVLSRQSELAAELADRTSTLGKLSSVARRMSDLARNVADAHRLSLEGDRDRDEHRKRTFRLQLQDALMDYAEAVVAGDECVNQLSREWDIVPNADAPVVAKPEPVLPAVPAAPAVATPAPAVNPAPPVTNPAAAPNPPSPAETLVPLPPPDRVDDAFEQARARHAAARARLEARRNEMLRRNDRRIVQPDEEPAGEKVEVLWGGTWFPSTILQRDGGRAYVHYDGWSSTWDEWVEADRLRPPQRR